MAYIKYPEFAELFKHFLQEKSIAKDQEQLAKLLGCSQSYVSKIMTGMGLPSEEMIKRIDVLFEIDLTENVEAARASYQARRKKETDKVQEPVEQKEMKPRLPITAAAGKLDVYLDGVTSSDCEYVPVMRGFPDYDFTMFIKGDSMRPKYESGDEIALKQSINIIEWGKDYVLATEDGAIFKRIFDEGDSVRCVSYNKEYPDLIVHKQHIYGYYKLVGLIRV